MNAPLFSPQWWQHSLLLFPILLMSFTYHEYAHAYVAYRLGDKTPLQEGRLTTNPLKHIDLIGFLLFFLAGFGWAKPVKTNTSAFKNPHRDLALVAISGPLTNIILAVFFGILIFIFRFFVSGELLEQNLVLSLTLIFLIYGIYYNILQAFLNLLPIPPLDGSRILYGLLPQPLSGVINILEKIGPFILLYLILSGSMAKIMLPAIDFILNGLFAIFNIFP